MSNRKKRNSQSTMVDRYIEILELANGKEYVTESEILTTLRDSEKVRAVVRWMITQGSLFEHHFINQDKRSNSNGNMVFTIRPHECFQLLQYYELKEARSASKTATRWAIAALVVSLIGSIASLISNIL